jgi:hypothetical protein
MGIFGVLNSDKSAVAQGALWYLIEPNFTVLGSMASSNVREEPINEL